MWGIILILVNLSTTHTSPYKKYNSCKNHGRSNDFMIVKLFTIDNTNIDSCNTFKFDDCHEQTHKMHTTNKNDFNNEVVMQSIAHEKTSIHYNPICPSVVYASNDFDITKLNLTIEQDIILFTKLQNKQCQFGLIAMSYLPIELYNRINDNTHNECYKACFCLIKLALHTGILHGDPHSCNIMLLKKEQPIFIDFGRACSINTTTQKVIHQYALEHKYKQILKLLHEYEYKYKIIVHGNPKLYSYIFKNMFECNDFDEIMKSIFKEDEIRNKTILYHHKKTTNKNKITLDKTMFFDYSSFM